MHKRILNLLLFQFLVINGISQDTNILSGKIVDDRAMPIIGVTVYMLNSNRITVTDSIGYFEFRNIKRGKYLIEVSATGFADIVREVDKNNEKIIIELVRESVQLSEVIVSAQKKEELLQKLPFSVSAFSFQKAENYRLWNTQDLTAIVPNLFLANPGDERNVTSLRGITSTSYDPAVSTYMDGVNQFSLDTYIQELFDIERIEIIRGPQGTLYGRNAMGGVINIITKTPGNSVSSFADVSVGNYSSQRYNFGVRVPIIKNKFFAGAAFLYNSLNGFYKNEFDNSHFDSKHSLTGNYYLKYQVAPELSFSFNMKHHNNRNNGAFPLVMGISEAFSNPFRLNQNAIARMTDNTTNYSFVGQYTGKTINLTSQTAFQQNYRYYNSPLDGDFSPVDGITIINNYGKGRNNVKVWTQEFRITNSPDLNSHWNWTSGVYLFEQRIENKQATHFGENADLLGLPDKNFSILNTLSGGNSGIAFFGQVTHKINEKLYLTVGMRYEYENKKQHILGEYLKDPDPNPQFETRPDTSAKYHFGALSPKVSFAYQFSKDIQYYVSYSQGNRTGGFTPISSDPSQPPLYVFKPEYSNNYEAGIKTRLKENRIQLNIAIFNTAINNAQVPSLILPDALTITKNAGKLNAKGVELEFSSKLIKGLEIDYNFGYTHAIFKLLKLPQNGVEQDLSGNRQIFTPSFTSAFVSQYNFSMKSNPAFKLSIRGEWMVVGNHYFDLANTIKQKGYNLFNARLSAELKKTGIALWVRNAADKKYIRFAYDFGGIHLGDPRTYGITLKKTF